MKRIAGLSLLVVCAWSVPSSALAQWWPWFLRYRVRLLESRVAAQGQRIVALEEQVEGLGQSVTSLQTQVAGLEGRVDYLWTAAGSYTAEVDCDAGESLVAALNAAPASVPVVRIGISGTCRENIDISRSRVSLYGIAPDATIEAPAGVPIAVFVKGRRIRLDDLVIRASASNPGSEALRVLTGQLAGANLRFEGGVSAMRNATLELFGPVIENAGPWGVGVFEDSYAFVSDCEILDATGAGVMVDASAFSANNCSLERSGANGLEAHRSNVYLAIVSIVDSAETGVLAELGSSVELFGGLGQPSQITGGFVGLELSGGSTAYLGESTIEQNQDGVVLGDASVLRRLVPYSPRVTGNTGAGVRCAPAPAVPQVALLGSTEVFGNGQDFVGCALP